VKCGVPLRDAAVGRRPGGSDVDRLIGMVGAEDVSTACRPACQQDASRRAIARALAAQPEVVLYDEPTTMVDPIIARRLATLIQRLKQQLDSQASL